LSDQKCWGLHPSLYDAAASAAEESRQLTVLLVIRRNKKVKGLNRESVRSRPTFHRARARLRGESKGRVSSGLSDPGSTRYPRVPATGLGTLPSPQRRPIRAILARSPTHRSTKKSLGRVRLNGAAEDDVLIPRYLAGGCCDH
jgi:hypothetical protein